MRWRPNNYDDMPWWGWVLLPVWGPPLGLLVALIFAIKAKRDLLGPRNEWQRWLAWHPIVLPWDGEQWPPPRERVWLEMVERRAGHFLGEVEYRPAPALPRHPMNAEGE